MSKSLAKVMEEVRGLTREQLIERAVFAGATLSKDEKGNVLMSNSVLMDTIALLEADEDEEEIESIENIINKKEEVIMSNEKVSVPVEYAGFKRVGSTTGTGVYCKVCLEEKKLHELTLNAVNYCVNKGFEPTCMYHQAKLKVNAKKAAKFEKNRTAGNVCWKCGKALSDAEVVYNKEHHNEYPEGLQDNLYCKDCQPNKKKEIPFAEYVKHDFTCTLCNKTLNAEEKELNYYHHNKFGKGLHDCVCCMHCAPAKAKEAYNELKGKSVKRYEPAASAESKVAETPATYTVKAVCDCHNKELTAKEIELNAIIHAMPDLFPEYKNINICLMTMIQTGVLKDINK